MQAKLSGEIWGGSCKFGGELSYSDLNRSSDGFTFNSVTQRLTGCDTFTCAPGDETCIDTQAFTTRICQEAYDVDVSAFHANGYVEFDKDWDRFAIRTGLRFDYNDVLKNVDVAPRMTGIWKATDRLSITVGANRYYSQNYLAYAIHDGIPRGVNERREFDASYNLERDWYERLELGSYRYCRVICPPPTMTNLRSHLHMTIRLPTDNGAYTRPTVWAKTSLLGRNLLALSTTP